MLTKLEQVLGRCLGGREIAVWGNPTRSLTRALNGYKYSIAGKTDPAKHYVVAVTENDFNDFLCDGQSENFKYPYDCVIFEDPGGELPFEWECHGVKIGRQTYFGESVADACRNGYMKRIGHFTSINGSAKIAVNLQLNMTFVSDDIEFFFDGDNKKIFREKLKNDPAAPYAINKTPLTIGSDVYIGAFAFVNASKVVTIGDGAIIGSGAVVLNDVPPYAVAVGVPAAVKRYRFPPDMIEALLRVKWWEWSAEEINKNSGALMSPELFMKRFGKK